MAGILDRIAKAMRKRSGASPGPTDPRQVLDEALDQQTRVLQEVRRGIAEVASARRRLDQQLTQMSSEMDRLTAVARQSVQSGRDDLATAALQRKTGLHVQLTGLEDQLDQLQRDEEQLVLTSTRLQAKLDSFRMRQQTVLAASSVAEARERLAEILGGLGVDLGLADQSVRSVQDRRAASVARLDEVDQLLAGGGTPDQESPLDVSDDLASSAAAELAGIKAELAAVPPADASEGSYRQPEVAPDNDVQDNFGGQ